MPKYGDKEINLEWMMHSVALKDFLTGYLKVNDSQPQIILSISFLNEKVLYSHYYCKSLRCNGQSIFSRRTVFNRKLHTQFDYSRHPSISWTGILSS